jgi:hypothetical protein
MESSRPAMTVFATLWLTLWMATTHTASADPGARPADALLRLVPPDAAVVVTVEGLRDQARTFGESRLAAGLRRLPAVQAWLDSEKCRQFEHARAMIETTLGANLTELRDELLGDAVVLALRLPSDAAQEPRGLVLIQARNRALLQRVIRIINLTQQQSGELSKVVEHQRAGTTYHVREFAAAAGRPPEWYVDYPDGTLALSNSETLIHAVIDRKGQPSTVPDRSRKQTAGDTTAKVDASLCDLPKFKSVEHRLPERALVRLFVDPRRVERLITAAPRPSNAADDRLKGMLERYLGAVDYAGAALVWSDRTLVLHAVEMLDRSKLDPWIVRLCHDARPINPAFRRVPPTALAVAAGHVDALALWDALALIVPDEDQPRLTNIETVLTGLFLGQDLRSRVLPKLGPGILGYLDSPSEAVQGPQLPGAAARRTWPFPPVLVVSLGDADHVQAPGSVTVAAAVDNALRTVLALTALDEKRAQGRSRIVTRTVAGAAVTTLDTPLPFTYAIDRAGDRLVLSTSADSVVRYLEGSSSAEAGKRFEHFQTVAFPKAETFLCVDLDALHGLGERHRDILAQTIAASRNRPVADVKGDLDHVLPLAGLFQAAFVSSRIEPDATAVYHSAGLILHDQTAK